jgi:hypothetical protein
MKDTGHRCSGAARGEADVTRFWDDEVCINLLLIRPPGGLASSEVRKTSPEHARRTADTDGPTAPSLLLPPHAEALHARPSGLRAGGRASTVGVEVGPQLRIRVLQVEDHGNADQVQAGRDQLGDPA